MKKMLWVPLFFYFIALSVSGCNKNKAKEWNKNSVLKSGAKVNVVSEPVVVSDISIEKFNNQKQTIPSNEKSDYIIKFKVVNFSNDSLHIVTLKDSSCVYVGWTGWQKGIEDGSVSFNSSYSDLYYQNIYLNSQPVQLYYPIIYNPIKSSFHFDSIKYHVKYYQNKDSTLVGKFIYFKVTSTKKGPRIELWEEETL